MDIHIWINRPFGSDRTRIWFYHESDSEYDDDFIEVYSFWVPGSDRYKKTGLRFELEYKGKNRFTLFS